MTSLDPTSADLSSLAGSWALEPSRTSVVFHTKAMWVLKVKGSLAATSGGGTIGPDGAAQGTFVLDASSVDTGNAKRDTHLRTPDFFDVEQYPTMIYTATGAKTQPDGKLKVDGTLTIHGQTRPLPLVAEVAVSGGTATVTTEFDIDRSQWGVSWAKMGAGLQNHVVVSAAFAKA